MKLYEHFTDINTTPFYKVFTNTSTCTPDKIFVNDDWDAICLEDNRSMLSANETLMVPFYRIFRISGEYLYLICCDYPNDYMYHPIKFANHLGLFSLSCILEETERDGLVVNWLNDFICGDVPNWGFYYYHDCCCLILGFSKTLKEKVIEAFKDNPYLMNKEKVLAFLTPCYVTDKEAHDATLIANNPWVNHLDEYYDLLTK